MPSADPNLNQQPTLQPEQRLTQQTQSMSEYKQRMANLKAQSSESITKFKESVNKGIDDGKADPVFEGVYKFLSDALCAPYDILSYMLINIVNLSSKDKLIFSNTGTVIALGLAVIYVIEFLLTAQVESLISVLACIASMILVRSFKGFDIQASINLDELLDEDDLYL